MLRVATIVRTRTQDTEEAGRVKNKRQALITSHSSWTPEQEVGNRAARLKVRLIRTMA